MTIWNHALPISTSRHCSDPARDAAREQRPDFLLISAGFDAYENDPLGGMGVTAEGFGRMTRIVREIAQKHCSGILHTIVLPNAGQ